jgi:hypothetical protein
VAEDHIGQVSHFQGQGIGGFENRQTSKTAANRIRLVNVPDELFHK